jgi:hypothetical protein
MFRKLTERNIRAYTEALNIWGSEMAQATKRTAKSLFADKKAIQRVVAEQNREMGFVKDPTATAERAQEMMLALGIRPEDNLFSSGIVAARDDD